MLEKKLELWATIESPMRIFMTIDVSLGNWKTTSGTGTRFSACP